MPEFPFVVTQTKNTNIVFDCRGNTPAILYWGARLPEDFNPDDIAQFYARQEALASTEFDPPLSLTPSYGEGFTGQVGLSAHRKGLAWGGVPKLTNVEKSPERVVFYSEDKYQKLLLIHQFDIDFDNDVLACTTEIKNLGDETLQLDWCAAPCFPIPVKFEKIFAFEGRWSKEFQLHDISRTSGTYLRENRKGRTSHDSFPSVLIGTNTCGDEQGEVMAFHLGWSGNHRICIDDLNDNRALAMLGELLLPGEVQVRENESYTSPKLYASYSTQGFNGISQRFHQHIRQHVVSDLVKDKPRPIHFNTWEALYFDHDLNKLNQLVDEAAAVGAERFVLDDGWFNGRRHDRAGLGDWYVDKSLYPEGLTPLVDRVKSAGMEFGLWFEPEMVNPDSDLYRAHPDWVLQLPDTRKLMGRSQLVLDLDRQDVFDYLFERLDSLLSEYDIAYVKWDMNRDIHQAGNADGKPGIHAQNRALYRLIQKVRAAHPAVEIESCASGGGRADLGILAHTDRVWTSDSNDALDRLSIQRGFSLFFPPELMGSHVGPYDCHITGRKLSIETRIATAFFGHLGMEVNLLELSKEDKAQLQHGLGLHKRYRGLLHSGRRYRFVTNAYSESFAVIDQDAATAIYSYTDIDGHNKAQGSIFYFKGLPEEGNYTVELLWPNNNEALQEWAGRFEGRAFSGALLRECGVQLPILFPQSALLFVVNRQS